MDEDPTGRRVGGATSPVPPWRSPWEAIVLIARGVTFHTAARVALVVGTILTVVNQGSVMVGGDSTIATWIRVVVNYLVPYLVSSIGYLAPCRERR